MRKRLTLVLSGGNRDFVNWSKDNNYKYVYAEEKEIDDDLQSEKTIVWT